MGGSSVGDADEDADEDADDDEDDDDGRAGTGGSSAAARAAAALSGGIYVAIMALTSLLISKSAAVTVCAKRKALAGAWPSFPAVVPLFPASLSAVHQFGSFISSSSSAIAAVVSAAPRVERSKSGVRGGHSGRRGPRNQSRQLPNGQVVVEHNASKRVGGAAVPLRFTDTDCITIMNDDYLRLRSIPAMFGREMSYTMVDVDGKLDTAGGQRTMKHVLRFAIKPAEDLVIDKEVEVEATYPSNFMSVAGQVVLRTRTPSVFFETGVLEPLDDAAAGGPLAVIQIPWLENATKYPIAVWFYSARRALKRPTRSIWKTPCVVKHNFIESKRQYAMEGFISDVDPNDDTLTFSSSGRMNVLKGGGNGAGGAGGSGAGDASVVPVVGAGRTKGRRNYMEDCDFAYDSIRVTPARSVAVFGVLDGHGGKECAQYCADEIPVKVL